MPVSMALQWAFLTALPVPAVGRARRAGFGLVNGGLCQANRLKNAVGKFWRV
jgi:hypothetical protein